MKPYTIISFYTKNTGYELEVKKLKQSLQDHFLIYDIDGIDSFDSWSKNTRYKAEFIKKKLQKYERVVFIDADAIVKQEPVLFNTLDCDVAVHYRRNAELLSGTMYWQRTENSLQLLDLWAQKNMIEKLTISEQRNLQDLIQYNAVPFLRIEKLPATYCQIFDIMKAEGQPIIEHFQASRKYRKVIGL